MDPRLPQVKYEGQTGINMACMLAGKLANWAGFDHPLCNQRFEELLGQIAGTVACGRFGFDPGLDLDLEHIHFRWAILDGADAGKTVAQGVRAVLRRFVAVPIPSGPRIEAVKQLKEDFQCSLERKEGALCACRVFI